MSPLLLFSILLVIGSFVGSIVLWARSGETRVGLFGGLFLVFAAHQGIELWFHWGDPLAIDASAATAIAAVLEGLLSVGILVALSRTLGERDRVEAMHWDSMEAVRVMNELSSDDQISCDAKVSKLLESGKKRYEMEVGMFSRVSAERYEVLAVDSPDDFLISKGAVFSLEQTLCKATLESERPIAIERISESSWNSRLDLSAFRYGAYLGATIRVGGLPYGTLSFASTTPRKVRFTGTDKDLVGLMARWLGSEIERRGGAQAYVEQPVTNRATPAIPFSGSVQAESIETESVESKSSEDFDAEAARLIGQTIRKPRRPPASLPIRRERNANRILQRLETSLRALLGNEIALELKLDPGLALAAVPRVPIDAIVRTLVMNARDAMATGGELVIETANLELTAGEPGVVPAIAPDQYVTIAVRDSGSEPNADTLSRLYDPAPDAGEPIDLRDPEARLPLSALYRTLQHCGGDLSVDVEQGRGSTFTVYLPRARHTSLADATAPAHSSTAIAQ